MTSTIARWLLGATAVLLVACGGTEPPAKAPEPEREEPQASARAPMPQMQQELGSIDERAVEQTFKKLQDKAEVCHEKGRERIEYLTGDVKVFLRIDGAGKVRYGYFEESTLGDRETEKCILQVYADAAWPRPQGGEAEVRYGFGWGPGGEREPVAWGPEKVMEALSLAKPIKKAVHKCKGHAPGTISITGYVVPSDASVGEGDDEEVSEPAMRAKPGKKSGRHPKKTSKNKHHDEDGSGKFQAIGLAASTREAAEKADCIVDALKELELPSPGSYAAKVSYTLP